ncbi:MAG: T9SS type A sorting domain-containing protein [Candidatus Cloacimonetes bacterium]|nr:T9SS type A sorting domain-containing protein [Candidatus Cloacimonadota bacterium]
MQKKIQFVLLMAFILITGTLLADVLQCNPQGVARWTGTTDGATITDDSEVRGWDDEDGWFRFDISGIPLSAIINSVEFHGYVNDTNYPYWAITPLSCDPLTADAATLFADIIAEEGSGYYLYQEEGSAYAPGWKVHGLGAQAATDLQAGLANGWWACGMASTDNDNTYYLIYDGWNEANPPYIVVDYTIIGAPDPVTNPFPADGATGIAGAGVTLTWDWGANTDTYDLYLDTVNPPVAQVVADAAAGAGGSYVTGPLDGLTGYYWQVVSKNSARAETSGPVWSFQTAVAAGQVLIGTGTATNECLPMEPYYEYSLSQSIYLQSDINMAGQQIETIKYHYNGNSAWTEDIVIYMGHTSQTALTDWLPLSNFIEVFNGQLNAPAFDGWVTLTLDNPFYYNNTDNLVVMFDANTTGYTDSDDEFYCTQDLRADVSIYWYDDGTNADPAAPPAGTLSTYYPNTVLQFGAVGAPAGNDIYISEVSDNLVGQPETTGYVELFNNKFYSLDLTGCTLVQGVEVAGVFIPNVPEDSYVIPAGTIIGPKGYLAIGNGADAATFDAAWGTSGIDYLPGVDLDIANGYAYQINNPLVRAELDHSPDVDADEQVVQMDNDVWAFGTPAAGTPGAATPGQTLPVELSSFTALVTTSETVMLEWVTQSETGTLGYHVLRGDSDELQFAGYMTAELIAATNTSEEMTYQFEDIEVWENNTYWYWLETIDADGSSERFGPISCLVLPQGEEVPDFFTTTSMNQNCPNPFNPDTKIIYSLRGTDGVPVNAEMAIYNMRGQLVKTLFSGSAMPGVDLSVTWHGKDDAGNSVGSGVYFYKLTSPGFSQIRKMMLLK